MAASSGFAPQEDVSCGKVEARCARVGERAREPRQGAQLGDAVAVVNHSEKPVKKSPWKRLIHSLVAGGQRQGAATACWRPTFA